MADTTQDTNQGCPNIRVCPYMDEKQRAEVEAGKFIRNPITAYVVRPKTVKGIWDLISKCDYNPQGDCSYPRHFTHTLASMELGNQCLQKENLNASRIAIPPNLA
ncbi:hypothetical protein CL616_02540 [archaeon]|nr:hypothetical protein [archaeon]